MLIKQHFHEPNVYERHIKLIPTARFKTIFRSRLIHLSFPHSSVSQKCSSLIFHSLMLTAETEKSKTNCYVLLCYVSFGMVGSWLEEKGLNRNFWLLNCQKDMKHVNNERKAKYVKEKNKCCHSHQWKQLLFAPSLCVFCVF